MKVILTNLCSRGGAVIGGVLLSLLVARLAGAEGLGAFAVFLSLLGALGILARHGKAQLLVRAVAGTDGGAAPGLPVTLLLHDGLQVVALAFFLGGAGSLLMASGWLGTAFPGTVGLMPLALPLLTVLALVAGYAKGRSRAWVAPLFEVGGISLVAALLLSVLAAADAAQSPGAVTGAFLAALVLITLVALIMVLNDMPRPLRLPALSNQQRAELRTGQASFTAIAFSTFLTQTGSFLLAAPFLSDGELGLLRAAERLALLVSFPVLAINPVIAPRIVRLSRGGEVSELRHMILRTILVSGALSTCVVLPLLIWPERALGLMGAEFGSAAGYLQLMALAQFAAAIFGPLAVLLNMSGRERASMWINLATLAVAITLVPGLSWISGASGFAAAYIAIIIARNLLTVFTVIYGRISLENPNGSRG